MLYQRKNLSIHASAIQIIDDAFIFIGLSGGGKSYLVSELLEYGKLITEDISRITFQDNTPYVNPSHCLMKLDNLNHTDEDFFLFNSKLSYDNRNRSSYSVKSKFISKRPIELKACFLLNFSNKFSIKELNEKESFAALMQSSFKSNPIFCSKENDIAIDEQLVNVINTSKFYIMNRKKEPNNSHKFMNFIKDNFQ